MKKILVITMVLAVIAVMVVPLAVSADDNGQTTISGNIAAKLELVAPGTSGAYSLGTLNVGPNSPSAAADGSISCNDKAGYNVTVASNKSDGKMQVTIDSTTYTLHAALVVTTGDQTSNVDPGVKGVPVTTAVVKCISSNAPGVTSIPLSVSQVIAYTDAAVNGYSIVLTYTATAGTP